MTPSNSRTRFGPVLTATVLHVAVLAWLVLPRTEGMRSEPSEVLVELFSAPKALPSPEPDAADEPGEDTEKPTVSEQTSRTPNVSRTVVAEAQAGTPTSQTQSVIAHTPVATSYAEGGLAAPQGGGGGGSEAGVEAAGGTGRSAPAADPYPAMVLAWVERHKRYPGRAQAARMEGVVVVAVTLDRWGKVRDVRLVSSSGHGLLDDAALTQIRAAEPFPAAPKGATWTRRRFEASLVYRLRPAKA